MAKSNRFEKKQKSGHSRAAYASIASVRSTANSEKRKAKAVAYRAACKAKVLKVPRGTARAKRRFGMVQKRQSAAVAVVSNQLGTQVVAKIIANA